LSRSDLVFFKGDLNHRKLTYDCAAPASTPFDIAIGPMASAAGAPKVCSLRTIKSDVVVGLESDEIAERLDKEEPGWKISGKYVSSSHPRRFTHYLFTRNSSGCCSPFGGSTWGESPVRVEIQDAFCFSTMAFSVTRSQSSSFFPFPFSSSLLQAV